jgi:hypothetical protein
LAAVIFGKFCVWVRYGYAMGAEWPLLIP